MANKFQFKNGLSGNRISIVPIVGEPIYTTDDKRLYIGDGSTAGGVGVLMSADVTVTSSPNKIVRLNSSGKVDDSVISANFATKAQLDAAISGVDFQADVNGIQTNNTLVPELILGRRYIITSPSNLNAAFGSIAGLGQNDIVQYNGTGFVVAYDVSSAGSGSITWVSNLSVFYLYDGSTWSEFGGLAGVTAGDGLTKNANTLNIVGTANRIAVTTDAVDIASTYVGQASITTLGTIATGVWQATAIADTYIASAVNWNAKLGVNSTIDGGTY
jgi:hypothetical protein